MSWPCQFVSHKGERCRAEALHRLFFQKDDPFTFMDLCEKCAERYQKFLWREDIPPEWREEPKAYEK